MLRHALVVAIVGSTLSSGLAAPAARTTSAPPLAKWPPWVSIEAPVNPYDASARGAVFLVHAMMREGTPTLSEVSGAAEGIVDGKRRTVALRFDPTDRPGVFAVRRQWPTDGAWIIRVTLRSTTAIVTLDRAGNVASARVPTEAASGDIIPRPVLARDIDAALARVAWR